MQLIVGVATALGVIVAAINIAQKRKEKKKKETTGVDFKIDNWY